METPTLKFLRVRDVKLPNRANLDDAGLDFFIPAYSTQFADDLRSINVGRGIAFEDTVGFDIPPKSRVLIPSGIKPYHPI